jgi:hypothetical protein
MKRLRVTKVHNVGTTFTRVAGATAPVVVDSVIAAAADGEIAAADLVMGDFMSAGAVEGTVDSAVAAVSGARSRAKAS